MNGKISWRKFVRMCPRQTHDRNATGEPIIKKVNFAKNITLDMKAANIFR